MTLVEPVICEYLKKCVYGFKQTKFMPWTLFSLILYGSRKQLKKMYFSKTSNLSFPKFKKTLMTKNYDKKLCQLCSRGIIKIPVFLFFWVYGGLNSKILYFIHVDRWLQYAACILYFLSHIRISFWLKFTVNWSQMAIFLKQVFVQV